MGMKTELTFTYLFIKARVVMQCAVFFGRYTWLQEDEESMRLEGPRSVLTAINQPHGIHKPKHVSFARSHTLTSFEIASRSKSPPRPHAQERLIDTQPTAQACVPAGMIHPYPPPEPKILILGNVCPRK